MDMSTSHFVTNEMSSVDILIPIYFCLKYYLNILVYPRVRHKHTLSCIRRTGMETDGGNGINNQFKVSWKLNVTRNAIKFVLCVVLSMCAWVVLSLSYWNEWKSIKCDYLTVRAQSLLTQKSRDRYRHNKFPILLSRNINTVLSKR